MSRVKKVSQPALTPAPKGPVDQRPAPLHAAQMHFTIEWFSPERAAAILRDKNPDNRPVSVAVVKQYAKQMVDWNLTGEPIIFDTNGNLLNGQHRLHACMESNAGFWTLCVYGVPRACFPFLDVGKQRSAADALFIGNFRDRGLAAAVRTAMDIRAGFMKRLRYVHKPTNSQFIEFVKREPRILDSLRFVRELKAALRLCRPSIATALHFLFTEKDPDAATKFFNDLDKGEMLPLGDSVALLRNTLLMLEDGGNSTKQAVNIEWVACIVIKAWNARREARVLKLLKWQASEEFPEIK